MSQKILIVEDDEVTALNLKMSLEKLGYEVGATDYIIKPFSPNRLIDRIHEILVGTK